MSSIRIRARQALLLPIAFAGAACQATATAPAASSSRESSVKASGSRAHSTLDLQGNQLSSERRRDPLWLAASSEDPLELARLARREGAQRLLEVVQAAGMDGRLALAAVAHAPDAWSALPALCDLTARVRPPDRMRLLSVIHRVAVHAERLDEYLDPASAQRCIGTLGDLAGAADAEQRERDLAASAAAFIQPPEREKSPR